MDSKRCVVLSAHLFSVIHRVSPVFQLSLVRGIKVREFQTGAAGCMRPNHSSNEADTSMIARQWKYHFDCLLLRQHLIRLHTDSGETEIHHPYLVQRSRVASRMHRAGFNINICFMAEASSAVGGNRSKSRFHSFVEKLSIQRFPHDEMQTRSG